MANTNDRRMQSFRAIRSAVVGVRPRPMGFPLDALRDPDRRGQLRAAPHSGRFLADLRGEAARARSTVLAPLPFSLFHLFEATGDRVAYDVSSLKAGWICCRARRSGVSPPSPMPSAWAITPISYDALSRPIEVRNAVDQVLQ